jgi:transposase-like protein
MMAMGLTKHSANALLTYLQDNQININPDFRREMLRLSLQSLMEWEVSSTINAGHYERVDQRKTYRNGYRPRVWRSSLGEIPLYIPKLRQGTYNPDFLRTSEAAILDMANRLYVGGADEINAQNIRVLCEQAGLMPMESSECHTLLDTLMIAAERARQSRLSQRFTSIWLDTINPGSWQEVKIAAGIDHEEQTELLTFSDRRETTWSDLLGDLVERGLRNVDQVLTAPDAYARDAIRMYLPRAAWQISAISSLPRAQVQAMPLVGSGMWVWADEVGALLSAVGLNPFAFELPMGAISFERDFEPLMAIAVA